MQDTFILVNTGSFPVMFVLSMNSPVKLFFVFYSFGKPVNTLIQAYLYVPGTKIGL